MLGKALQMYAEDLNFTVNEDCAYGIHEGYLMTLYDSINRKTCFINYYLSEEELEDAQKKNDLLQFIKDNIEVYQIDSYEVDINGVSITVKDSLVKLTELIEKIVEALKNLNIKGADYCSECGCEVNNQLKKVAVDLNRYGLCLDCTSNIVEESNNSIAESNDNESENVKDNSFISTLIIFFAGTILWTVLAMFEVFGENNNLILGVLIAILLPIIHSRLYDMFGGEQGKKKTIIICVTTVVVAIISIYISCVGATYANAGITSFDLIIKSLKYALVVPLEVTGSFFSTPFYKELIVSILVSLISIILFVTDFLKPKAQTKKSLSVD